MPGCSQHRLADYDRQKDGIAEEFVRLKKEYSAANQEFYRPALDANGEQKQTRALGHTKIPAKAYLPRFVDLAGRARGTDTGAAAWMEVFTVAGVALEKDIAVQALDTLLSDFIDAPQLRFLIHSLPRSSFFIGGPKCEAALRSIADRSPLDEVKADAKLNLAALLVVTDLANEPRPDDARKLLDEVMTTYPGTEFAKRAEGQRFELDQLQIGMVAPDFEATDRHGKAFRLSDYRGRVVVLDFWGFW